MNTVQVKARGLGLGLWIGLGIVLWIGIGLWIGIVL
jgi:hypothetical protein